MSEKTTPKRHNKTAYRLLLTVSTEVFTFRQEVRIHKLSVRARTTVTFSLETPVQSSDGGRSPARVAQHPRDALPPESLEAVLVLFEVLALRLTRADPLLLVQSQRLLLRRRVVLAVAPLPLDVLVDAHAVRYFVETYDLFGARRVLAYH